MWHDITIKDYNNYLNVLNTHSGATNENDNTLRLIDIVSVLSNIDKKTLDDMPYYKFTNLLKQFDFIKEEPNAKLKDHYNINGSDYTVNYDVRKINTAQWLNLINLTSSSNHVKLLHKFMAIVLLPSSKKRNFLGKTTFIPLPYGTYDISIVEDELYNHMSIDDALALSLFFCSLYQSLQKIYQCYMEKKVKIAQKIVMKQKQKFNKKIVLA